MTTFLINMAKLFGIIFLRFRLVPRVWCAWLVAVNGASLAFITQIEGQVVLAVTGIAVVTQTLVYGRNGFTRILGTTHILWVPMFAWMALRWDAIASDPAMAAWVTVLFVTNLTSFVVDVIDALRFARGERAPHYQWALA